MLMRHLSVLLAVGLFVAASTAQAAAPEAVSDELDTPVGNAIHGQMLAGNLCSGCHALDAGATSPNPDAPNFHELELAYPPEYLAEGFAEGIVVGTDAHIGMPQFELAPNQIDDLIAYLETVLPPYTPPVTLIEPTEIEAAD